MFNWRWQVCNSLAILPSVPPGKQSLESAWQDAAIAVDAGETYLIVISCWYESQLYLGWLAEPYTFWVASQYQIDSSNSTFCLVWKWSNARCPNPSSIWSGGSLLRLNKKYTHSDQRHHLWRGLATRPRPRPSPKCLPALLFLCLCPTKRCRRGERERGRERWRCRWWPCCGW